LYQTNNRAAGATGYGTAGMRFYRKPDNNLCVDGNEFMNPGGLLRVVHQTGATAGAYGSANVNGTISMYGVERTNTGSNEFRLGWASGVGDQGENELTVTAFHFCGDVTPPTMQDYIDIEAAVDAA
jgi:hypothetical protein